MEINERRARFADPYGIAVPKDAGFIGEAPFWSPGDAVTWTFRRFDFERDHAEVRRPMQVIEDGPEGAVLWLPGRTPTTDTRIVGWEDTDPHDVPLRARFGPTASAPRRVNVAGAWRGRGVLKIVPARVPFSVWVLLRHDDPTLGGAAASGESTQRRGCVEWYVNLEATHRRTSSTLFTSDHILDITFPQAEAVWQAEATASRSSRPRPGEFLRPERAVFKDVDELTAAATYGMWTQAWADIIRRNGMSVLEDLDAFAWAFDPSWEQVACELAEISEADLADRESHRVRSGCYDRDWI